jgi:D-glucosaminate-6-phosphate ammonia-lyase
MPNRRGFLHGLTGIPVLGGLGFSRQAQAAVSGRDYFRELGVRPFINAAGTYTMLTASLMQPEAVAAMNYASRLFVRLDEVQDAVGKRIAELTGAEAAMVTSGAAGALTVGTAGCITGDNRELIQRLPDTTGAKNEVIIQKSHRYGYDHAVRSCGVKLVEVESAEDLERAVNPRTAMMLFFNNNDPVGQIHLADFVQLGKKHNVPTFNDASADVPPVENLTKYVKLGFDLVTFSGGKGICGPQSAGVLVGRKDLIRAARLNTSPYSDSVSRGMKVNKEEMLGMMVALENYVKRDHQAEWREWEKRAGIVRSSGSGDREPHAAPAHEVGFRGAEDYAPTGDRATPRRRSFDRSDARAQGRTGDDRVDAAAGRSADRRKTIADNPEGGPKGIVLERSLYCRANVRIVDPASIATYCLPFTAYVIGDACQFWLA